MRRCVQMQKLLTGHIHGSSFLPCQPAQLCFHKRPSADEMQISDAKTRLFHPLTPAGRNSCFFDSQPGYDTWLSLVVRGSTSSHHLLLTTPLNAQFMSVFFYDSSVCDLLDAFLKFLNQAIGEFSVVLLECMDVYPCIFKLMWVCLYVRRIYCENIKSHSFSQEHPV